MRDAPIERARAERRAAHRVDGLAAVRRTGQLTNDWLSERGIRGRELHIHEATTVSDSPASAGWFVPTCPIGGLSNTAP